MKVTTDGCLFGALVPALQSGRILDIGSGTGLLSLMIAQKSEDTIEIDAVEINQRAYQQARENFRNSEWAKRLMLFNTDIQSFSANSLYNMIVSNPPFFSGSQKGIDVGKNTALHDDMLPMSDLIATCVRLLAPDGQFWVIYPEYEMTQLEVMARKSGLFVKTSFDIKNKESGPVFRSIKCFSPSKPSEVVEGTIVIRDDKGNYTPTFTELLKPYYLHL